jgi:hypothetical protein
MLVVVASSGRRALSPSASSTSQLFASSDPVAVASSSLFRTLQSEEMKIAFSST